MQLLDCPKWINLTPTSNITKSLCWLVGKNEESIRFFSVDRCAKLVFRWLHCEILKGLFDSVYISLLTAETHNSSNYSCLLDWFYSYHRNNEGIICEITNSMNFGNICLVECYRFNWRASLNLNFFYLTSVCDFCYNLLFSFYRKESTLQPLRAHT